MVENLSVVIVEPNKEPYTKEIKHTLENLQDIVDGLIEPVHCDGLPDGTVLVCNEEGKFSNLEPNRLIYLDGLGPDIIFGIFFVVGEEGENFVSLTDEQEKAVIELFQ